MFRDSKISGGKRKNPTIQLKGKKAFFILAKTYTSLFFLSSHLLFNSLLLEGSPKAEIRIEPKIGRISGTTLLTNFISIIEIRFKVGMLI